MKNIAYLGPVATFTHEAALVYFGADNNYVPVRKIQDILFQIYENHVEFGVVPSENSVGGTISDTLDLFVKTGLKIYDQVTLKIEQNLMSTGKRDEIKTIFSHHQSFLQCSNYISKNFGSHVDLIETYSNAEAAKIAADTPNSASIGSRLCLDEYSLKLVESNINDSEQNETKFFIVSRDTNNEPKVESRRAMVIFYVPNKSGSLFDVLKIFKHNDVNMTKIESRPSKSKNWEYVFVIEYDFPENEKKNNRLLEQLGKKCDYFDYLGHY